MIDKDGKSKERYLFLFKARILVCKVRRISEDRSVFVLKDIIRVSECFCFTFFLYFSFFFFFFVIKNSIISSYKTFFHHPLHLNILSPTF